MSDGTYHITTPRDYVEMNRGFTARWLDEHAGTDARLMGTFPGGAYPTGVWDLLLAHAREYPGHERPLDVGLGRIKECFKNAALLALWNPEYTYVEGYADAGIFPMHHAWVIDADGRVVDNTWRERGTRGHEHPAHTWTYYGIAFADEYVARVISEGGTYGVLDKINYKEPLPGEALAKEAVG